MEIDFNLDNYDLQDVLNLFNLNYNFTNDDFKISKKLVMQMHPDKSGLDKKYFLFYCKALRIVKNIYDFKNKKHNNLDNNNVNVEYSSVDVLNLEDKLVLQDKWKSKFDIIVSNPPYVRMQEKKLMQLNVIDHEPDIALFVEDDDPLLFYKRISELSRQYLKHNGTLYLEINEYFG